jgi:DnaJ-class molecular chaperone
VVYIYRDDTNPCPDCGGSGRYVGLNVAEDCERCGGSGRVPW